VWIAAIELDLKKAWAHRRESTITVGLAPAMPLLLGSIVAAGSEFFNRLGRVRPFMTSERFLSDYSVLGLLSLARAHLRLELLRSDERVIRISVPAHGDGLPVSQCTLP